MTTLKQINNTSHTQFIALHPKFIEVIWGDLVQFEYIAVFLLYAVTYNSKDSTSLIYFESLKNAYPSAPVFVM